MSIRSLTDNYLVNDAVISGFVRRIVTYNIVNMAQELNGKWKLIYADNVGEYCDAIGCEGNYRELALKLLSPENNITQDINIEGQSVTITTTMPGKTSDVKVELGVSNEAVYLDGRKIQSVFTVDDGKLKEEQSGPFLSTNVRFLDGNNMHLTMTANGVITTRKYERM